MHLYGFHIRISEIEKMTNFGKLTGPRAVFRRVDSNGYFSKAYIHYFIESYGGLVKLVA